MSDYFFYGNYNQPSVAELKKMAIKSRKEAEKQGKTLEPIIIEGRIIAKSWWGKAWCDNLERYADYDNRLSRGKRYVRNGSVIDLKIEQGELYAKVQGSQRRPYRVSICVDPLPTQRCQQIIAACERRIENLEKLLTGNFPEDLKELFTQQGGLFPTPEEIHLACSCPDWALMCKHVAAVLYGVGARLDENPSLFFTLRGIDLEPFADKVVSNAIELMLKNASQKTERVLADEMISQLFGV